MRAILSELSRIGNSRGRDPGRHFIAEGTHINLRAVRAGVQPEKLAIAESRLAEPDRELEELLSRLTDDCELVSVPDAELLKLAQGRNSGRVVGVFSSRSNTSLAQLLQASTAANFLVLVLVDVQEPGNVGALVRTALAGFVDVVVCVGISDPYHPKAVRTSMGSLFRIPVVRVPDVDEVLRATVGYRRYAAVASGGHAPWHADSKGPTALFVGNEARGLPDAITNALDQGLTVPMQDDVDSYSVNAATAILLYELGARRRLP